jgi:hypothetical protein
MKVHSSSVTGTSSVLSLRIIFLLFFAGLLYMVVRLEIKHHEREMHGDFKQSDQSLRKFDPLPQASTSTSVTRPTLTEIGLKTQTDKATHHGYTDFYPIFLERWRDKPVKMLEIGFLLGYSYQMWKEYFEKGEVFVLDKDKGYPRNLDAYGFKGNQGSEADLEKLLQTKGLKNRLDLIIDDGSHHPSHQLTSFQYLFMNGLKEGGVYIIEDMEINYWVHGEVYDLPTNFGPDHSDSMITKFKKLVDVVNREFAPLNEPFVSDFGKDLDSWVGTIFFGPNFVIITKMTAAERQRALSRRYRFEPCLDKNADLSKYEYC